jgi:hypothetical protein
MIIELGWVDKVDELVDVALAPALDVIYELGVDGRLST